MRAGYVSHMLLCALFAVPAVTLQGVDLDSLSAALNATMVALEELTGLEQSSQGRNASSISRICELTEAPSSDPARRDGMLESLRREVSELQMRVDGQLGAPVQPRTENGLGVLERPSAPTQGLSDAMRAALSGANDGFLGGSLDALPGGSVRSALASAAFEPQGYAADPLRLAITCFRAGIYSKALLALGDRNDQASRYWRARCLDRLGRGNEAQAEFEKVAADASGVELADRAREELEFLRWRLSLSAPVKSAAKATPPPAPDAKQKP